MDIQPRYTKLSKTIQTFMGEIVLEDPHGHPNKESNLYCLSQSEKIVWVAEKPDPYTLYSKVRLNEDGLTVSAYTIHSHACELDPRTGKLISFTAIK
jgi:hypothetical protein